MELLGRQKTGISRLGGHWGPTLPSASALDAISRFLGNKQGNHHNCSSLRFKMPYEMERGWGGPGPVPTGQKNTELLPLAVGGDVMPVPKVRALHIVPSLLPGLSPLLWFLMEKQCCALHTPFYLFIRNIMKWKHVHPDHHGDHHPCSCVRPFTLSLLALFGPWLFCISVLLALAKIALFFFQDCNTVALKLPSEFIWTFFLMN